MRRRASACGRALAPSPRNTDIAAARARRIHSRAVRRAPAGRARAAWIRARHAGARHLPLAEEHAARPSIEGRAARFRDGWPIVRIECPRDGRKRGAAGGDAHRHSPFDAIRRHSMPIDLGGMSRPLCGHALPRRLTPTGSLPAGAMQA
nr:hypothetical protein DO63_5306 [Burkholderia pseudomallei]